MVTRSDSVNICHDWMSALENTHYGFKHHLKWLTPQIVHYLRV